MGTRYSKGDVVEVQVHGNKEILVVDEVRKEDSNSPEYMVITTGNGIKVEMNQQDRWLKHLT